MVTADEARQLDRLAFGANSSLLPGAAGTRLARARGFGTEFHDFRRYQPGDDPRSLEWTISARLGHLVVRTFRADALLRVHLLVDVSASMTVGVPDKLRCAKRLAALLAYVGLNERDVVGLTTFDEQLRTAIAPASGRQQLLRLVNALHKTAPGGASSISRALTDFGALQTGPGIVVILSDFFDPAEPWEGLRYLLHRGLTPAVIQIVSSDELDPGVDEEIELVDVEHPAGPPLTIEPDAIASYRARLDALTASMGEFCVSRGCPWTQVRASASFGDLVQACQRAGLLTDRV